MNRAERRRLASISEFGTPIGGAHPDIARPEFKPYQPQRDRAWCEAMRRTEEARKVKSLYE